ncbi:TIM-barrel domain-containing protein [Prolixibacter bellariivorans]|uniref:TIM-barrel domain-containing protein n=1 Tax=Prolixibacter bellariivorans TaxID=314319 RepID=UPI0018FFA6FC|nr:TIM-barrel domain-containing protein [Prolixibacter bellariivorans]
MHAEIHNVFGLTWDKVVTEEFEKHNPNTRIFQMTRSAFAGMQRYTFGWSGDSGNGDDVTQAGKNSLHKFRWPFPPGWAVFPSGVVIFRAIAAI